jgi:hypothetical protein
MRFILPRRLALLGGVLLASTNLAAAQAPPATPGTTPAPVPAVPPPTPQSGATPMVPERVAPDSGPPQRSAPSTPLPSGSGTGQEDPTPKRS